MHKIVLDTNKPVYCFFVHRFGFGVYTAEDGSVVVKPFTPEDFIAILGSTRRSDTDKTYRLAGAAFGSFYRAVNEKNDPILVVPVHTAEDAVVKLETTLQQEGTSYHLQWDGEKGTTLKTYRLISKPKPVA